MYKIELYLYTIQKSRLSKKYDVILTYIIPNYRSMWYRPTNRMHLSTQWESQLILNSAETELWGR